MLQQHLWNALRACAQQEDFPPQHVLSQRAANGCVAGRWQWAAAAAAQKAKSSATLAASRTSFQMAVSRPARSKPGESTRALPSAHTSANSGNQPWPSWACIMNRIRTAAATSALTCRACDDCCHEQFGGSLTRTDRAGDGGDVGFAFHAEAQRLAAAKAVLQSVHSALRLRRLAPSICSADGLGKETEAQRQTVGIC